MTEQYAWAIQLLSELAALWPVERPLELVFAVEGHNVWAMHEDIADGACNIRPDKIIIFLRQHAVDNEYWRDVLIHEYAHAAMGELLASITVDVPVGAEAYKGSNFVQKVEAVTARVAGLLDYAVRTGAAMRETA